MGERGGATTFCPAGQRVDVTTGRGVAHPIDPLYLFVTWRRPMLLVAILLLLLAKLLGDGGMPSF